MTIEKRIAKLEQSMQIEQDPGRIRIIEVWGDRGSGPELLETHERKAGGWVKMPYTNAVLGKL